MELDTEESELSVFVMGTLFGSESDCGNGSLWNNCREGPGAAMTAADA